MSDLHPMTMTEAASWARPFLRDLLDHWLTASDTPTGLFCPYLDRQWQQKRAGPATLVSQNRVIYNFSRGFEIFGDTRYAEYAKRGLAAVERYFLVRPGRYCWSVSADGHEKEARPDAYGHAFCLLALATAGRTLCLPVWVEAAQETWAAMTTTFRDTYGGLVWHPDNLQQTIRSQNPLMHTFEALLALHAAAPDGRALTAAAELLGFMRQLTAFPQGRLQERFAEDWQPLPSEQSHVLDMGHQFEWALLLSDWYQASGEEQALTEGYQFLQTGLKVGLDSDGGAWETADARGVLRSPMKGLWQQCEALRALHRYAIRHSHVVASAIWAKTFDFYRRNFVDLEHGGLFARPEGIGHTTSLDKGDAWKLDYHSLNLCLELMDAESPAPSADLGYNPAS